MKSNEDGQSSVEYLLLVAVMIIIGISFFDKVTKFVIDNPNSLVNRYLAGFTNILGSPGSGNTGVSGQYKKFQLPR